MAIYSRDNPGIIIGIRMNELKYFKTFTLFLWILTLITMFLGPYVRAEDAGLACPDWPLCFGYVIPPYEYRIYLEFIHRVVAGILGIVFLVWLAYLVYYNDLRRNFSKLAVLGMILLAMQIILGRETVTRQLDAIIVKSHLLNAILYLTVILAIWVKAGKLILNRSASASFGPDTDMNSEAIEGNNIVDANPTDLRLAKKKRLLRFSLGLFVILIFLQFFLGGRVSANKAGLACTDFPACYTMIQTESDSEIRTAVYFPPMKGHVEIHMSHRFMGYIIFLYALFVLYVARNEKGRTRNLIQLISGLVLFQVIVGALNVIFYLPVPITVLHSALAMAIYVISFISWYRLKPIDDLSQ